MLKIGIYGSTGRMGQVVLSNVLLDKFIKVGALHAIEELPFNPPKDCLVTNDIEKFLNGVDGQWYFFTN